MEFFKHNANLNFMKFRYLAIIFSIIIFIVSIASIITYSFNWGLDFTGGTQIHLQFKQDVVTENIQKTLKQKNLKNTQVQSYGSNKDILITLALSKKDNRLLNNEKITNFINKTFPLAKITSINSVGAKVSEELANKGSIAVIIAMLLIFIYIAFRFEYRMAISASIALIHDPVLILGIFSFFHIKFDLTALAAILTVLGYSLNDTIVVFDRVRENFRKMRTGNSSGVINISINQTLSRTIMTSMLTLVVVIALLLFGGPDIFSFSLALAIGIIVGTYSSIYIAGALAIQFGLSKKHLMKKCIDNNN